MDQDEADWRDELLTEVHNARVAVQIMAFIMVASIALGIVAGVLLASE